MNLILSNEPIECICCYYNKPLSIESFIQCKADPKHLICERCYTDWGSNTCFFCQPLKRKTFYSGVSPVIDTNVVVHINDTSNNNVLLNRHNPDVNIDLSINEIVVDIERSRDDSEISQFVGFVIFTFFWCVIIFICVMFTLIFVA